MLIVADENMPYVRELFAPLGEVRLVSGRHLRAGAVEAADILLVRSVTRVDRALLEKSRVSFVGTATIGTDHLDLDYLQQRGIAMASAPGCNANAVVDFVLSALCVLDNVLEGLLTGRRVGIVGLGNVGSRLLGRLHSLGVDCVGYDPLQAAATELPLVDLDTVLCAEVICCHAPLTGGGEFPTRHLLDRARLRQLRSGAVLLNAGRGGVVDTAALKQLLRERTDIHAVLDVWEDEPAIDRELLDLVAIATPHIAGYSLDGKIAGTRMMLDACCRFLGVPTPPSSVKITVPRMRLPAGLAGVDLLRAAVRGVDDIGADDRRTRQALRAAEAGQLGNTFDLLRKNYPERREISVYIIDNWDSFNAEQRDLLTRAGFVAPKP